jgi:16S rRNA processing protein RimM
MKNISLIKIGTVLKVNRKTGELTVALRPEASQVSIAPDVVFLQIDGAPVPFFPLGEVAVFSEMMKITLLDYSHPDKAQAFVGADMLIENQNPARENIPFLTEQLIGYKVYDKANGHIGFVEQVVEAKMQYILQINNNDTEILVPLVDEFIVAINEDEKKLHLDLPDGLIGLNT